MLRDKPSLLGSPQGVGRSSGQYRGVPMDNTLYYGDNLDVLRQHVKDESVDLI
ncbi:hypothetical protein BH20ACT7_BH20ACT7_09170 [soil metagenome]